MNWGYSITLAYVVFISIILTMVISAFRVDVNLVAKDYYKKEIAYQEEIDKMKNTRALTKEVRLALNEEAKELEIYLPSAQAEGEIWVFRPNDYKQDLKIKLELDAQGKQVIPMSLLKEGHWRLKMDWQAEGQAYYWERKIQVDAQGSVIEIK